MVVVGETFFPRWITGAMPFLSDTGGSTLPPGCVVVRTMKDRIFCLGEDYLEPPTFV